MNYRKIDELAQKAGGSLRLTALTISRARQLIAKAPRLVEAATDDPVQIAFLELLQEKIKLKENNV